MGRTVRELQSVLSHREFLEWISYFELEPWGEDRADLRAGIIASTVANSLTLWTEGKAEYRPVDFMPYAEKRAHSAPTNEAEQLSDEELCAWADAAVYGLTPENA